MIDNLKGLRLSGRLNIAVVLPNNIMNKAFI